MSAPLIWIAFPMVLSVLLFFLPRERWITYLGTIFAALLSVFAAWFPPEATARVLTFSFRVEPSFSLFRRTIALNPSDQALLILIYGVAAFWFFGTLAIGGARRIIPVGLMITALLVASMAVEPFLYAGLLIEIAVLISIPMLAEPGKKPGRGLVRFLTYQTLAMPFILLAGFLLSGVDAGPSDIALIGEAAFVLGLGFAFLLSVFPLYTWAPSLAEESMPYAVGFIMLLFPTFSLLFGLSFMDRYSWLRDSSTLTFLLRWVGLLMMVSAGMWAAFQRHVGRIFAYAAVAETGVSLLALSISERQLGLQIFFFLLIPRALAYGVWNISIEIFKKNAVGLHFAALQGLARKFPLAAIGMVLSNLALAGLPLMSSFPVRQALWGKLGDESLTAALLFGLASLGLWVSSFRMLAVLVMAPEPTSWQLSETWMQRILLGIGLAGMILMGLFPQWAQPLLASLPVIFERVGQ